MTNTPFLPPGVYGGDGGVVDVNGPSASLHIVLSRIALYDHPLFTTEDDLFGQLRLMA